LRSFSPEELKLLDENSEAVVLVNGGAIQIESLAHAVLIKPESWLNVDSYNIIETVPIGEVPGKPHIKPEPPLSICVLD